MAKLLQTSATRPKGPLYKLLKKIVLEMREHQQAWPFLEPVSGVPDYYNIIKNPMGRAVVVVVPCAKWGATVISD